jgi:aminoglycoside 6'-N-acetyltransferase
VLHGERVKLRPLREDDVPGLAEILRHPDIALWWDEPDVEWMLGEYLDGGPDFGYAIVLGEETIGLISFSEEDDPSHRHAGVDITVAVEHQGEGLGTDALRTLIRHLFEDRGHWRVTIDPDTENSRAIRLYERIGFRPVGVMRRYERRTDGTFRDALLMDLLADEFELTSERGLSAG